LGRPRKGMVNAAVTIQSEQQPPYLLFAATTMTGMFCAHNSLPNHPT
jgi:hypothetical protein